MHHIVSSKCTIKCCEKGRAYRRKSAPLNGRNRLLTDSLVLRFTSTSQLSRAIRVQSSLTTISTPPSLDNRFCPNIAIASFLLINLSHSPTQFLHQSLGQHKERIGSCTCPLAVTPPSWSRFLSVQHFCCSKRSVVHSSGKKI